MCPMSTEHPTSAIARRAKRALNVGEFAAAGAPEVIGPVALVCPVERQYVLRMAVRVDGKDFHIPDELAWLREAFDMALAYQRGVVGVEHSFCYITVRHGFVTSETDDAWHVDGFSTRITHIPEQNYIWTNVNSTEFVDLAVPFPDGFDPLVHNVNSYLETRIKDTPVQQCAPGVLTCMDPYILHRRPVGSEGMVRTFVRISFVPIEINDVHNTPNPLIPRAYDRDGVAFRRELLDYPG